jgi:hypothetical protein
VTVAHRGQNEFKSVADLRRDRESNRINPSPGRIASPGRPPGVARRPKVVNETLLTDIADDVTVSDDLTCQRH